MQDGSRSFEEMLGSIVRAEIEGALGRLKLDGAAANSPSRELLKISEAAAFARVCKGTINNWLNQGKLKRYGNGRKVVRVSREELARLMTTQALRQHAKPTPEERAAKILGK